MNKKYRNNSTSGFYHVISRGINKQIIFDTAKEKKYFINLLKKYSQNSNVEIHAFCIMDNHFHLLIRTDKKYMSVFMQKLLTSYAKKYNFYHKRNGHLFASRFQSEAINDDIYFLTVFRYILQNPEKAMICKARDYSWSSIKLYSTNSFITKDYVLNLFNSKTNFYKFLFLSNNDECMEIPLTSEEKLMEAELIIYHIKQNQNIKNMRKLPSEKRNIFLTEVRKHGIPIKTISKITGISKSIIQNA